MQQVLTDGDEDAHRGELETVGESVEEHAERWEEAEGEKEVPVGAVLGLVLLVEANETRTSRVSFRNMMTLYSDNRDATYRVVCSLYHSDSDEAEQESGDTLLERPDEHGGRLGV